MLKVLPLLWRPLQTKDIYEGEVPDACVPGTQQLQHSSGGNVEVYIYIVHAWMVRFAGNFHERHNG